LSTRGAVVLVGATLGVDVAVAGCSDVGDLAAAESNVVTSRVALSLPSGSNISSVSYRVLSSGNATLAAGTIDVRDPGAALSLDLVLTPGTGDVVTLSAQTSSGAFCGGTSAPFDVRPGRPTFVSLTLVCGGDQPDSSSCPRIRSWALTPVQAEVPFGTIDVGVVAADLDGSDALSYSWTATGGALVDPSAAGTVYLCTAIGEQTLTLTVRDLQSTPACAATASFLVDCFSSSDVAAPPPRRVSG
jgi:hypothetical protein